MSFDRGRHAAVSIDQPTLTSDRRTFLTTLEPAVRSKPGLTRGIVFVNGTPSLRVISTSQPRQSVTITADYTEDDWWFSWPDGHTFAPVDDPQGAADVIARELGVGSRESS